MCNRKNSKNAYFKWFLELFYAVIKMPKVVEAAKLKEVIRGKENVERMDVLLSLAVTGGDCNWL